ncbi:bifunctional metallophosphatase/5'-nucleotidase [Phocicoccus pinnipedialis]|uniref:Endonuclease YhcR n=1 Tax=Phocicoccus pinnipedialis TaxID=110845 RepID=A0A6V7R829_9BACL|nr:bifunctional UDP-sugar hydrolase/5'-nucleotidase [Jeotgalicoccus pinnipedialis]MBP1938867.1 2',3'-cyclic-nucleotide 2'-phosphodiesterase (5'-nucleotidase family) [Jeotgalicoccus pinnipedialis]CAD2073293.1 Endonuclease YhcR precursor [Jeotgalicoccus pinnipedialis]
MDIHIFHTNDVHSHLHNYKKQMQYVKGKRAEYGHRMIYVDIGDHVDRAHPYTESTLGKANVALLDEAGCDVATIGNNEGITLPKETLIHLYDDADFDVVCVNLRDVDTGELVFKPYTVKEIDGVRIGFIAATVEFTPFYLAEGFLVEGAFQYLEHYLAELEKITDCIVVMSHLGMYDEERIAETFPCVDVILGAHTHHHYLDGYEYADTLISAAGRYGEYTGHVTLSFEDKTINAKRATLIETDMLVGVEENYYQIGKSMLEKTIVVERANPIVRNLYRISEFTYVLMQMLKQFTETDVALINSGLVADAFEGGTLTQFDLHRILPHSINAVSVEITGRELKEIYSVANQHEYKDRIINGLGFRGDIFGCFLMDGLDVVESERKFFVGGELVEDSKMYTIGTLDMYTFGRIFPQFKNAKKEYMMPEFLRDIVYKYKEML